MFVFRFCLLFGVLGLCLLPAVAQPGKFELVNLAEGVYVVVPTDPLAQPTDANAVILINETDVILVDANVSPSSARAVLAAVRQLTPKPIRYVINTHWHDDHVFGNQVYQDAYPQVEFLAQRQTRAEMETQLAANLKGYQETYPQMLATMEAQLASGKKNNGDALTEQEKARLASTVEVLRPGVAEVKSIRLVLPTLLVEQGMTLHRGARTIQLLHLGTGHTKGDLVVYLPQEKILITGDLLTLPVPFALTSYLPEWTQTLKKLRAIEADVLVPGHGAVQRNQESVNVFAETLEYVVQQTQAAVQRGLSLDETRKLINLEPYRQKLIGDDTKFNPFFRQFFVEPAIERTYKQLKTAPKQ